MVCAPIPGKLLVKSAEHVIDIDTNIDTKQIMENICIVNMINICDFDPFNAWTTASLSLISHCSITPMHKYQTAPYPQSFICHLIF